LIFNLIKRDSTSSSVTFIGVQLLKHILSWIGSKLSFVSLHAYRQTKQSFL